MRNTIQNFLIFLIFNINYLYANVSLFKTDGSCLSKNSTIASNIHVIDQEKLSDGVCFYHIYYYAGYTDKIVSTYDIVVVDRKKPYRLRPIVDISKYTGSRKEGSETKQVKNFGAFKSHSVMTFVKSRTKNVVAAINGPVFSFSNGKSHSILNRYKDGKETEPNRTFLYGGLNLKKSGREEPILGMSSNYDKLDLNLFFHNIGTVKPEHDFDVEYRKVYSNTNGYIKEDASLRKVGKNSTHTSNLDWAIGIASGSFMGQVYVPKENTGTTFPKNAKYELGVYGTTEKPRYWYENVANYPQYSASEIEPIVAYNKDYVILGLNLGDGDTYGEVKNEDVYLAFNSLGMKYGAYLDGGGSSQLVIKGSDGSYIEKGDKNDREVFSALAIVKAYPDLQFSSYNKDMKKKYKEAIYYLTDFGIFGGDKNGLFGAGDKITRAEFSKMIINLLKVMQVDIEDGDLDNYTDVDSVDWFRPFAKKVVGLGLMEGNKAKTKLSPSENITYWELSKMISIAFQGKNIKKPIESKLVDPKGGWHNTYLQCLNNYSKGYDNRFKEEYKNIFNDKLQSYYDSSQKLWFSKYAVREDVALFLYRAFILWQDGKFDDVSKSCVAK